MWRLHYFKKQMETLMVSSHTEKQFTVTSWPYYVVIPDNAVSNFPVGCHVLCITFGGSFATRYKIMHINLPAWLEKQVNGGLQGSVPLSMRLDMTLF
jgi:hypothetical protein